MRLKLGVCVAFGLAVTAARAVEPTLKEAFAGKFLVGTALNEAQFDERNAADAALVKKQFNSVSPENVLKWEVVHPQPGKYNFASADRFVQFGESNGMFVVGHVLIWHAQTPKWVFQDEGGQPLSREALVERMRDHIHTVVGHYKGRIRGWDVVNEALNEDGTMRQTPWMKIIGDDYLRLAFQFAHEADPSAELYYNDYSLENEAKLKGAVALLKPLKDGGVPVTGVGVQGHDNMQFPTVQQEEAAVSQLGALGLKVMITELDVSVLPYPDASTSADISKRLAEDPKWNPYPGGLPDQMQEALAKRYADLFGVFVKHSDVVSRVTFWGVTDGTSWLNNWPIRGRTNYPLLFDRNGKPKLAFASVVGTAGKRN